MEISIIIPFYNTPLILFKELINQISTIDNKFVEVLLIDDGSTDKQLLDFVNKLSKPFIIHHENHKGVSNARNKGILYSTKRYVLFIDSDDLINAQFLNDLLKNDFDEDIICLKSCYAGENIPCDYNISLHSFDLEYAYCGDRLLGQEYKAISTRSICAKLIKKDLIISNNIFFDTNLVYCEDCLFCGELYKYTKNVAYVDGPFFYFYRQNTNSQTRKFDKKFIERYTTFFNKFLILNSNYPERIKFLMHDTLSIHLNVRVCMSIKHFHFLYARKVVSSDVMHKMAEYYKDNKEIPKYRQRLCFFIREKLYLFCILLIILKRIPVSLKVKLKG